MIHFNKVHHVKVGPSYFSTYSSDHVFYELQICHDLLTTSIQYRICLSLPLFGPTKVNLSELLCISFTCLNHLNLVSLIPSTIEVSPTISWISSFIILSLNMTIHQPQHPHFRYFHFLNLCRLGHLVLYLILHNWSSYHFIKFAFKSYWYILITCDTK